MRHVLAQQRPRAARRAPSRAFVALAVLTGLLALETAPPQAQAAPSSTSAGVASDGWGRVAADSRDDAAPEGGAPSTDPATEVPLAPGALDETAPPATGETDEPVPADEGSGAPETEGTPETSAPEAVPDAPEPALVDGDQTGSLRLDPRTDIFGVTPAVLPSTWEMISAPDVVVSELAPRLIQFSGRVTMAQAAEMYVERQHPVSKVWSRDGRFATRKVPYLTANPENRTLRWSFTPKVSDAGLYRLVSGGHSGTGVFSTHQFSVTVTLASAQMTGVVQGVAVTAGQMATFSTTVAEPQGVNTAGTQIRTQWQTYYAPTGWTDAGAAQTSLYPTVVALINLPGGMGRYRAEITRESSNGNGYVRPSAFLAEGVLMVRTPPTVTASPGNAAGTAVGAEASFTAAATGYPVPTVIWQQRKGSGGWATATDNQTQVVSGQKVTSILKVPSVRETHDGMEYRAVFTNSATATGTGTVSAESTPGRLTLFRAVAVVPQPSGDEVVEGETAEFTAGFQGLTGSVAARWQQLSPGATQWTTLSEDFGTGAHSSTFTTPATTLAMHGTKYRVWYYSSAAEVYSDEVSLTVTPARPTILLHPDAHVSLARGDQTGVTLKTDYTGTLAPDVQVRWWSSDDGGTSWTIISGADQKDYKIVSPTQEMNGRLYQARYYHGDESYGSTTTNTRLTVTSGSATLDIGTHPPSVTIDEGASHDFTATYKGTATGVYVRWWVSEEPGGPTAPTGEWTLVDATTKSSTHTVQNASFDARHQTYYFAVFSLAPQIPDGQAVATRAATLSVTKAVPPSSTVTLTPRAYQVEQFTHP